MAEEDGIKSGQQTELTLIERRLVHSPAAQFDNDPSEILYQHSVLCQTCLPYRNPGDAVRHWDRKQGQAVLSIEAGRALDPASGDLVMVGLPFGPKPRLILAHLNAEALRTRSAEIEVEASLTAFVKRIGLDGNGRDVRMVKTQLARLASASVRMGLVLSENAARMVHLPLIEAFELWAGVDDRQRVLWPSVVRLNTTYFESLQRHAVPLHPEALGALSHSAMGLDVYAWLAQRLHRIKPGQPQLVGWAALREQFGWHYGRMDNFRRVFKDTLRSVLTQYPGAKIEADERGLILHHSVPPVLCRKSPLLG